MKISLVPYSLTLTDAGGVSQPLIAGGRELPAIIERLLSTVPERSQDRVFRVELRNCAADVMSGVAIAGESGWEAELIDIQTRDHAYRRRVTDAEALPFYFAIEVRPGADEALVVLQKFGNRGVRTSFIGTLLHEMRRELRPLRVSVDPWFPRHLWEVYLEQGHLREVELTTWQVPSDVGDYVDSGHTQEEIGPVRLRFQARRSLDLPLLSWVRRRLQTPGPVSVHGISYDDVKVRVNYRGSQKTIDLSTLDRTRPSYDITDEIKLGADAHPEFSSIDETARRYLREFREELDPKDV